MPNPCNMYRLEGGKVVNRLFPDDQDIPKGWYDSPAGAEASAATPRRSKRNSSCGMSALGTPISQRWPLFWACLHPARHLHAIA